ncbi:hypothetical protein SteCoe_15088 [Stentor coeruleus]|uniref:Uncharacterized protein n=1 Tax=Stentor coeruleus TaxID=5963 RepID=A0A1R2C4B3_9CILI|nr:hypothetical protein SteCoe_15088 [Stentor coeruleus]
MSQTPRIFDQRLQNLNKKIYIEIIEDFRKLPYGDQDKLIQELRSIYGPHFDFSEEYLGRLLTNPSLRTAIVTLARERKSGRLVSVIMVPAYTFELNDNDHSLENRYSAGHGILVVDEKYRMGGLTSLMTDVTENILFTIFPNENWVEYGFMISPYSFYYVSTRSKMSVPSDKPVDPNVMRLFNKIKSTVAIRARKYGNEPYVMSVFPPVKNDLDFLYENMDRLPKTLKYYVDKTGLVPGVGILTMQICYLVKGNTINLPAGDYIKKRYKYNGQINYIQGNPTYSIPVPKI